MSNDPLHGKTLKDIVEQLVNFYGFDTLAELINIKCFKENPSVKSSLTFLRKTDWARKKVEEVICKNIAEIIKLFFYYNGIFFHFKTFISFFKSIRNGFQTLVFVQF